MLLKYHIRNQCTGILTYFRLLYTHINKITYDKLECVKLGFSIFVIFWSSFIKFVYLLEKHYKSRDIEHFGNA